MKILIDACVLYPTVMRELVLGVAARGLFEPLWSARILEEWARAAAKISATDEVVARGEIAMLRAKWPKAEVLADPAVEATLYLPDPDDLHVLAAAIAGKADVLLTLNLRDFPTNTLSSHGILRRDPDGLLREYLETHPDDVSGVAESVRGQAEQLSGMPQPVRALFKKARLPKLAKALEAQVPREK